MIRKATLTAMGRRGRTDRHRIYLRRRFRRFRCERLNRLQPDCDSLPGSTDLDVGNHAPLRRPCGGRLEEGASGRTCFATKPCATSAAEMSGHFHPRFGSISRTPVCGVFRGSGARSFCRVRVGPGDGRPSPGNIEEGRYDAGAGNGSDRSELPLAPSHPHFDALLGRRRSSGRSTGVVPNVAAAGIVARGVAVEIEAARLGRSSGRELARV